MPRNRTQQEIPERLVRTEQRTSGLLDTLLRTVTPLRRSEIINRSAPERPAEAQLRDPRPTASPAEARHEIRRQTFFDMATSSDSWEALAHRRSIRRISRQQVEVSVPLHGPSDHAVWLEVCSQLRRFVYVADSTAQFTSSLPIDPPQGFGAARFHAYFSSVMGFAVPKYTYQHRGVLIVVSFVSDSKIPENACRQPDLFPFELEEAIRQHPEFSPVDEDVG